LYDELIANGLIGTDEAGKGDYCGPLVCAACYVDSETNKILTENGIRDSKKISDGKAFKLAVVIKNNCPYSIVVIGPEKYNQLYSKMKNLNRLLAWAHAKAIETLVEKTQTKTVLADQFGKENLIADALKNKVSDIRLLQAHKAEANIAVAAASILARAEFLNRLNSLSDKFDVKLRAGAGIPTDEAIKLFIEKHGREKLELVVKIHFKNTKKVLG